MAEIKAMGYTGGRSMLRYYIQSRRKMRPSKKTVRFETQPGYQLQHDWGEVEVEVEAEVDDAELTSRLIRWSSHVVSMSSRHQSRMLNIPMSHWSVPSALIFLIKHYAAQPRQSKHQ